MQHLLKYLTAAVFNYMNHSIGNDKEIAEATRHIQQQYVTQLEKEIDELVEERQAITNAIDTSKPNGGNYWRREWNKYASSISWRSAMIRVLIEPELHEQSNGDLMLINEFKQACLDGGFIDSDGSGYYATKTKESRITIYPSDVHLRLTRDDFTHVMWFSK